MTTQERPPAPRSRSLWRWVAVRMSLLAVGVVLLIALAMWLRLAFEVYAIERRIPPETLAKISVLKASPEQNDQALWTYLRQYYKAQDLLPSVVGSDWLIFYALVLASIPLIIALGFLASRPLSRQFSVVAATARRVTSGDFSARAELVPGAPLELNRLAEDFNAMCEKLSRYEREVLESSAILAHELRTPLNAAMGRVQGILDGVFAPEPDQLTLIHRQLTQLNRLISDLHFLSMARAGELHFIDEPFDMAELVAERMAWSSPAIEEAGMVATFDAPPGILWHGDRGRVGQVISILIENALRYAAAGKALSLRVRANEKAVTIDVQDRGPGIAEDDLPRVFDRFWRAEHSRGRHSGGSGLGLSIADVVVEAHGGSIVARNRDGGGLVVTLTLPYR
ncbi:two-component sensor histidine kinase [Luteibacter flocculans]|uniref:histidine kinase n=1 Tax=Luteibacter flocculans TaxID=2780091 RepID=A0ABY4T220_9GAMM|nr:ATP-binding protein [Luteibacter flocculans]URL58998.1 two-component sensor histidine kinase [Luteibacter flocculans]